MKKLLPIVFLLIGLGAGVGAGILFRPEVDVATDEVETASEHGDETHVEEEHDAGHDDHGDDVLGNEYAKLNNQFVVPIVAGEKVIALIVLALSIEVPNGKSETVYLREPKLRDSFLQVLFDHANVGGFKGNFTDAQVLGHLREALNEVAQKDLGKDIALNVLIEEIARQDY